MELDELNTKVNDFIEKHNILEKKLNNIIYKFDNLELKLKYCTCKIYAPYTENGECRFCHGYN